jgi:hypothetical protein
MEGELSASKVAVVLFAYGYQPEILRIRIYLISMRIVLGPTRYDLTQLKFSSIAVILFILPEARSFAALF